MLAELKYSTRSFARAPGLALALLITIAIGIGSNASVLGFVRGSLTRGLPIPGIDALASVFARDAQGALGPVSLEDYLSLKTQLAGIATMGAVRESQASVVLEDRSSMMSVAALTPDLAGLFQFPHGDGVVISHRVWQIELDGKDDVRGTPIRVNEVDARVAGVAPDWLDGLYFGRAVDIWMPLSDAMLGDVDRRSRTLWAFARLRPGASIDRARAVVNANRNSADAIGLLPYTGATPDAATGMSRIDLLLRMAGLVVFFIACGNVASFLLARASARSHETSVRVALGAGRGQLAGLLLSDSVLISVVGAACGLLLAVWTMQIVPALFFDQDAEHLVFDPDLRGIVAAAAACAGVTIVCGLIPYFELRHRDAAAVLQRESAGPSRSMRRFRGGLVIAQMTCCCLLVFSTTVLIKCFRTALQTSVGDRLGRPILATLEWPLGYRRADRALEYFGEVERAALSMPDITTTAWIGTPPGSRPAWQPMRIEPPGLPLHDVVMNVAAFTPRSLAQVMLPPIAGRMFAGADTAEACKVAIVNTEAAEQLFDGDAVGRSIEDPAGDRVEIVGVVATRKAEDAAAEIRPTVYYYADQTSPPLNRVGPGIFRVPKRPPPANAVLDANVVSPGYFSAMGIRPIAGTVFPDEPPPRGCRIGMINQEAAERYFGGHAVGGAVIDTAGRRTEIIGVVQSPLLRASQRAAEPAIYFPMAQDFRPRLTLILGAREPTDATLGSVRRGLEAVPGGTGRVEVTTLDAHLSRTALAPERIASVLVGASAAMALTLGVLGLYGAMMEAARQRRREIALRIALGASGWRIISQVLAEGTRLAAAGIVAGTLGSMMVARWLARITSTAGVITVSVWLAAPLILMAAVVVASVGPARRALTANPLAIMRDN